MKVDVHAHCYPPDYVKELDKLGLGAEGGVGVGVPVWRTAEERIAQSRKYLELGIPVFTVDYCIDEDNAYEVYEAAREYGFIPLVTRVSLSGITETPPY